jgi:EAL domain-containing protein (putative c-di-GMP-specific phosphodiesterase class I)
VSRPIYILSLRQRDELAALAAGAGWPVVASRRAEDAVRRFTVAGASVAVVDTRGGWERGRDAVLALAQPVAERGAGLLVLVSRGDIARLEELRAAGATQFLASPFEEGEFVAALRFAEAGADRRGAGRAGEGSANALGGYLGRDLERALAADEIEILFQPQVGFADGAVVGVEALMRWRHGELGELGAEALLDAADRAGLGRALSARVQERALAAAAAWPASLDALRLAVNITAEDVAEPGFAATLLARVVASSFPSARLTVEVTERGLIDDPDRAAAVLAELRAVGLRVAIDDFGTGYSSLAYLSQLPLDYLKLDRALTQDIAGSPRDRTVVKGIIDLAHSLDLTVVAEGVETAQQRDLLARAGCAVWQGYLCAGPLTTDELAALVAS